MVVHTLKKIWFFAFVFTIFGLLALVPLDKYQTSYMNEFHKIKAKPQKHVDEQIRYVQYLEEGGEPTANYKIPVDNYNNKNKNKKLNDPRYRKPYFIRDKNNPNILYPYRG